MAAFATFLERSPEATRARVTMLQITPKSRSEVPEYARMQRELEQEAGHINGKLGEVDWTPLRYINKSMSHSALAGLYRMSRIGLVTPLRDGMNLVAKIAGQPRGARLVAIRGRGPRTHQRLDREPLRYRGDRRRHRPRLCDAA